MRFAVCAGPVSSHLSPLHVRICAGLLVLLAVLFPGRMVFCDESHEIATGDWGKAQALLKADPRLINFRNSDGVTPLMLAAAAANADRVKALLSAGADVNATDDYGDTALIVAASSGDADRLAALIAAGADVNAKDSHGDTALMVAASAGDVEGVKTLLAAGADIKATTAMGGTALHYAASQSEPDLAALLIDKGMPVDTRDNSGCTPLIVSAMSGNAATCQLLLDKGADVNAVSGKNALPPVPQRNDPGAVADAIRQSIADWHREKVAARQKAFWSTLASVAFSVVGTAVSAANPVGGQYVVFIPSIRRAAATELNMQGGKQKTVPASIASSVPGRTPLHYAVMSGSLDTVKLLIDKGARLNVSDAGGVTPTSLAVENGANDIAAVLVAKGSVPLTLPLAVRCGSDDDVARMLAAGGDVKARDDIGYTPLHYAAQLGRVSVIQQLVDKGADVNQLGASYAVTPLWSAATADQPAAASALLERGAKANVAGAAADPLAAAVKAGYADMVKLLIDHGASLSDPGLMTAAVISKNPESVKLLLDKNVDPNDKGAIAGPPIDRAAALEDSAIAGQLLAKGAVVTSASVVAAARNGRLETVKLLMERVDQKNTGNLWGKKSAFVLHAAASGGNSEITKYMMDKGAKDDINLPDASGRTPLQCAVKSDRVDAAKFLLANGADVKVKDSSKATLLHYAICQGNAEMTRLLIDSGVDLSAENYLQLATDAGQGDVVGVLLSKGLMSSLGEERKMAVLESAIRRNKTDVLEAFTAADPGLSSDESIKKLFAMSLEHRRSKLARYFMQKTPSLSSIHLAALLGQTQDVKKLLDGKANVNEGAGTALATPLHHAVVNGSPDVINLLLANQADINAADDAGLTPLHVAVLEGQTAAARTLIDKGANLNAKDMLGANALLWAAYSGNVEIARSLVAKRADMNDKTADGYYPIIWAAQKGNVEMIRVLGEGGADFSKKDPNGYTALDLAVQRDYKDAAELIRQFQAKRGGDNKQQ